ncbi:MAG: BlaI/MecI/CopY family transcriptional regulator [Bacteroidetes bacterium]|nr:MAG: BlaI/MecI/CopY family transcriptional regulator [Bacteroidota bacterium]
MNKEKKVLTKVEEQVMQVLWQQKQAFLKEVVEAMPLPTPHSNTVATILKILIEKGFATAEAIGRNNLYKPTLSRDAYSRQSLGKVVNNYFNGSYTGAVSFLVDQKQLSIEDLELLLQQMKQKED